MPILLEIVTPERLAYSGEVDSVQVPGSEGEMGILPHHAPLVSMLGIGELLIRTVAGRSCSPSPVASCRFARTRSS